MIVWKADRINEEGRMIGYWFETTGSVIEVSCYAGYLITEKSGHNNLKYTTCVSLNNQLPFTPWPLTVHLQVVSLMMHGIVGPPLFHFPCGPRLPHSSS